MKTPASYDRRTASSIIASFIASTTLESGTNTVTVKLSAIIKRYEFTSEDLARAENSFRSLMSKLDSALRNDGRFKYVAISPEAKLFYYRTSQNLQVSRWSHLISKDGTVALEDLRDIFWKVAAKLGVTSG